MTNRKFFPPRVVVATCAVALVAAGAFGNARLSRSTGEGMISAANAFLASLSAEERQAASVAFDDKARLDWHFIPKDSRKGLQIKNMTGEQRKLALALVQAGLSEAGYGKLEQIIDLESILHELEKGRPNAPLRDPERYYLTIFGEPSSSGAFGYSFEGHHLSLNFVVRDGKIDAFTPFFFGANPAEVKSNLSVGPKQGTRVLRAEEELAFDLLRSLDAAQKKAATIAAEAPKDIRGAGEPQPPQDAAVGLAAEKLSESQLKKLWSLIEAYTSNMPEEVGVARLAEIKAAGIGKVHFAWAGADKPGIGHYYRVQGPTFLVEFVNTQPDSLMNPANHIHSVWRQMAGDFGNPIK